MSWISFITTPYESYRARRTFEENPLIPPSGTTREQLSPIEQLSVITDELDHAANSLTRWFNIIGTTPNAYVRIGAELLRIDYTEKFGEKLYELNQVADKLIASQKTQLSDHEAAQCLHLLNTISEIDTNLFELQRLGCLQYRALCGTVNHTLVGSCFARIMCIDPSFGVMRAVIDQYSPDSEVDKFSMNRIIIESLEAITLIARNGSESVNLKSPSLQSRLTATDEDDLQHELMTTVLALIEEEVTTTVKNERTNRLADLITIATALPRTDNPLLLGEVKGSLLTLLEGGWKSHAMSIATLYKIDIPDIRKTALEFLCTDNSASITQAVQWLCANPAATTQMNSNAPSGERISDLIEKAKYTFLIGPWHRRYYKELMQICNPQS